MKSIELPNNSPLLHQDFVYGVATASFQIEGSADSRLPSIWDTFCATPGNIADGSDGRIACDHINHWQQDVELIAQLGVDAYRLSVSWPRVMQQDGSLNQQGVQFYVQLLDSLNARGIKVFVTLYHWDLPQHVQDNGGWLNRQTAYLFRDYADKISRAFGHRVFAYTTFNEPFCIAQLGHETGVHAPGLVGKEYSRKVAHHVLLAHGLAIQVLRKNRPEAKHGIVLNFTPCYPDSESSADIQAADYANQYINHWYARPLFEGRYPDLLELLPEQQRPLVEPGDMDIIAQPLDYLGINFYTRQFISAPSQQGEFYFEHPHRGPITDIGWEICPSAFTELLLNLHKCYDLPPIYITENGAAMADAVVDGQVHDNDRIDYYQSHLLALHEAVCQGVRVHGYFAWSLMDNFEWAEGYSKRFGLVYVDYQDQSRTIKDSGKAYQQFITSRQS